MSFDARTVVPIVGRAANWMKITAPEGLLDNVTTTKKAAAGPRT